MTTPREITWCEMAKGTRVGAYRTGQYWAPGPVTDSAWVIPDDGGRLTEGYAVCVYRQANGQWVQRPIDKKRSTREHHQAVIAACRDRRDVPLSRGADGWVIPLYLFPRGIA